MRVAMCWDSSSLSLGMRLLKECVPMEQICPGNKPPGHNFYLTHIPKKLFLTNVLSRAHSLNTTNQRSTAERFGGEELSRPNLPFLCQSILWSFHTNSLSGACRSVSTGTLLTSLGVHTAHPTTDNENTSKRILQFSVSHQRPPSHRSGPLGSSKCFLPKSFLPIHRETGKGTGIAFTASPDQCCISCDNQH